MKRQWISINRLLTISLAFLMVLAFLAPLSRSATATSDLGGQWVGTVDADSRNGTIELALSRQGAAWQAAVKVELPGLTASNPVTDLKITETELSFTTEIAGAEVRFAGKLVDEKIVGKLEVNKDGRVVATGNWTATRPRAGAASAPTASQAISVRVLAPMPLQKPAVSRTSIAFSFAGDLWLVDRSGGDARRLTSGPGEETNPVFSPDGSQIAFTKNTGGDADVYTIPATGGEPRRLTFHPKPDFSVGWTPDGSKVLFTSMRISDGLWRLFTIPAQGGFPTELPFPMGVEASFSPDGTRLAYVPLRELSRAWRNYRGGLTAPIWIARLSDSSIEELPRDNSNDTDPMWVGSQIYFLSDRSGTANLFVYDPKTRKTTQLTMFEKYDIKSAAACDDAIVFAQGGRVHLYDLKSNQERVVEIGLAGEFQELNPRTVKAAFWIRSAELSPTGKQVVFSARGEVLTLDAEKGEARNLTKTPGAAERSPVWSPDGKSVAYFSDESGEYQLHVRSTGGDGRVQKIAIDQPPSFYHEPVWSPDSSKIAFSDKRLALWLVALDSRAVKRIDSSTYAGHDNYSPAWSPDSRWLAYSKNLPNRLRAIFVHSIQTGKNHQVTDGRTDANLPAFDQSGKFLYFTASANAAPSKSWGMEGTVSEPNVISRVYAAVLKQDGVSPLAPRSPEETGQREANAAGIDVENIGKRLVGLPIPARNYTRLAAGKAGVLMLMDRDLRDAFAGSGPVKQTLYKFDLSARKTDKLIEEINGFSVSADGGKLLYRKGGSWAIVSTDSPVKADEGKLELSGLEISVDPRAEWKQMFDEVWRIQREYFIDPNLHGQNLASLKAAYAAYLPNVVTRSDLNYIFRDMVSHLTISHMGVGGGDLPLQSGNNVGLLGADYQIDRGRYRITQIYRGDNSTPLLTGPLAQPGVNVNAGDYLLAVDGQEIQASENLYRYFQGKAGRPVQIKVGPEAQGSAARTITVVPMPGENTLRRYNWNEENRRKVEEASGGKLGYLYLPNFGFEGYSTFIRDFYSQLDKQGLIIDQRFSPGGSTADLFIDLLKRVPLAYYNFRAGEDLPFPIGSLPGPKVLITNQFNGSSADTFPWLFREANVGLLVGKRTAGAGIGHYADIPELIDGGRVTAPNRAFYNPKKGSWDIENYGVAPDIDVELLPAAWRVGRDLQLEKAIQVAMAELKKSPPPSPKRPQHPVYK